MNSNESQNPSAAGQPHPAPAAPNPGPEPNAAPAPTPAPNKSEPIAAPASPPVPAQPVALPSAAAKKKKVRIEDPTFGGVLGKLETLSPAEEAELFACEEVIESGWATFVQVGLALATIKEKGLFRTTYGSFEQYCRDKWQYSERYAYHLISAAQVFRHLCANCSEHKPCHEAQVRPLVGLTVQGRRI